MLLSRKFLFHYLGVKLVSYARAPCDRKRWYAECALRVCNTYSCPCFLYSQGRFFWKGDSESRYNKEKGQDCRMAQ